ncbi:hypothetical protein [Tsukamurella pulmonis]|uniref:hypothetical protein n=1 Tax=Tsukamurella pulmonis TaxID=47312 RepID=UPI000E0986E7|nr:hypothetical protein [Tsukamurella pulmonis]RDH13812.1 hypothetical protein DVB88_00545 [Tsukamurella pulmonis]
METVFTPTGPQFGPWHILLTAAITAALVTVSTLAVRGGSTRADDLGLAVTAGAAVWLWRSAANIGALNLDGLPSVSANDCAAPMTVFVALSLYAAIRPPTDLTRWHRARAAATVIAVAVNIIAI